MYKAAELAQAVVAAQHSFINLIDSNIQDGMILGYGVSKTLLASLVVVFTEFLSGEKGNETCLAVIKSKLAMICLQFQSTALDCASLQEPICDEVDVATRSTLRPTQGTFASLALTVENQLVLRIRPSI